MRPSPSTPGVHNAGGFLPNRTLDPKARVSQQREFRVVFGPMVVQKIVQL